MDETLRCQAKSARIDHILDNRARYGSYLHRLEGQPQILRLRCASLRMTVVFR
jgi:hypothetical protein